MGDNKRKAPGKKAPPTAGIAADICKRQKSGAALPSTAAAGTAQKRRSVPASPPGSPRAAAAGSLEDLLGQIRAITDQASGQTADIKRELAEAKAAAASAEAKRIGAKAESETQLANLRQQLKDARQANAKTALQPLPRLTQYSQSRTEAVPPGGAIFEYLEENFLRTVTRHRGPRQGDPHRAAPQFQVRTFRVLPTMRLEITPSFSLFLVSSLVSDENLLCCKRTAVP